MAGYTDLGVDPVINARGTLTVLGGSLMDPAVLEAMTQAATQFVDMIELQARAGERIAELLGVEAACVTSGAAAGLTIATAAFMAQDRPEAILALPETAGLRDQVMVLKSHRIQYDQAILLSGASFLEVGVTSSAGIAQVDAAISERTACLFFAAEASGMRGSLPLRELADHAHSRGVPVLVDAAAELPPADNVRRYLDDGADLVVFSGGKEIGGPQSSGLIVGREPFISHCHANSFPHHGIGRGMKTDKETIVGLVTAVELWVQRDYDAIFKQWDEVVATILDGMSGISGVSAERGFPSEPGIQPTVIPRAYLSHAAYSAADLHTALLNHKPQVAVGVENDRLAVNPQCLKPNEVPIVVAALQEVCRHAEHA